MLFVRNNMTLADRLKIVRNSLGMSQSAIAQAAGSSLPSWQGYEAGKNIPGGKVLEALACMKIDVNWLLTGEGSMTTSAVGGDASGNIDWDALESAFVETERLLSRLNEKNTPIKEKIAIVKFYYNHKKGNLSDSDLFEFVEKIMKRGL